MRRVVIGMLACAAGALQVWPAPVVGAAPTAGTHAGTDAVTTTAPAPPGAGPSKRSGEPSGAAEARRPPVGQAAVDSAMRRAMHDSPGERVGCATVEGIDACVGRLRIEGRDALPVTRALGSPEAESEVAPSPVARSGAPVELTSAYTSAEPGHVSSVCQGDPDYTTDPDFKVQVVHAYTTTTPSPTALAAINSALPQIDTAFQQSAQRTGGNRRVRWVTGSYPTCRVQVRQARITSGAADFTALKAELQSMGAISLPAPTAATDPVPTKYLIFTEGVLDPADTEVCGLGNSYKDDSSLFAFAGGNYNLYSLASAVDASCWGLLAGGSAPAHELMHTLGAVQSTAPNYANSGHCDDEYDLMCYGPGMTYRCPQTSDNALFDCGNDDYFNTDPLRGSYLCERWNTSDSYYLEEWWVVQPPRAVVSLTTSASPGTLAVGWGDTASCYGADYYRVSVSGLGTRNLAANGTSFSAPPGTYTVTVWPVLDDGGGIVVLGTARQATQTVPNYPPTSGIVLSLTDGRGYGALVYAIDPETNAPTDIRVTIAGVSENVYRWNYTWADMPRYTGLDHTESLVVLAQLPPGTRDICFEARDPQSGGWVSIGCRTHTVK